MSFEEQLFYRLHLSMGVLHATMILLNAQTGTTRWRKKANIQSAAVVSTLDGGVGTMKNIISVNKSNLD